MIYIEEIIILDFLIDCYLLYMCALILKNNYKKYRLFLSALFGCISSFILFNISNNIILFILKILISIIMILIMFGYESIKTLIKNTINYNILNFFLGGVLYYLKISDLLSYKYVLFFIPLFLKIYKYFVFNLKSILRFKYKVTVYLNSGKVLFLNGYMDSGNNLIEPYSNRKVIIINKKIDENFYLVPYKTINSYSLLKCFNPRKVYIEGIGERNDISIGVINKKFNGYNCLLNYKLMEDIC